MGAEPLYQRALAITQKTLGPTHPNLAPILGNYAMLLETTNRSSEAAKLREQTKALGTMSYGGEEGTSPP